MPLTLASIEPSHHYFSSPQQYENSYSYPRLGPTIVKTQGLNSFHPISSSHNLTREAHHDLQPIHYDTISTSSYRRPVQTASNMPNALDPHLQTILVNKVEIVRQPVMTQEEKKMTKLFLALLLNLIDEEKKKHAGSRNTSPGSNSKRKDSPKKIGFGSHVEEPTKSSQLPSILDSKKSSSDLGTTIQKLEATLNQLEQENRRLAKENNELRLKLRGVDQIDRLREDAKAVVVEMAAPLLDSAHSPFFKANTSLRKTTSQKSKTKGNPIQYGDHVKEKIEKAEKFLQMKDQILALEEENSLLKQKNQTYEGEINELYHRIDKFGSLEIGVAELIQENERLRQILVKITGQIHQNF